MARDALLGWLEASRRFGFHNELAPEAGEKLSDKLKAARDNFRQARLTGIIPAPDVVRGNGKKAVYLWRESTIDKWATDNAYDKRQRAENKKARQRANAAEPKQAPSRKEATAAQNLPQRAKSVKREAAGAAHG